MRGVQTLQGGRGGLAVTLGEHIGATVLFLLLAAVVFFTLCL